MSDRCPTAQEIEATKTPAGGLVSTISLKRSTPICHQDWPITPSAGFVDTEKGGREINRERREWINPRQAGKEWP